MPKKPARNAFYFFMQDFREEQKKKGVMFNGMAEVAEIAGPLWKDAPKETRAKFEAKAQKEKQKVNGNNYKFTSQGVPYSQIEEQEKEIRLAEERERKDIKNLVNLKAFSGLIKYEELYVMDVNYLCQAGQDYVICEFTMIRFNLHDGIIDEYHEIVNPGDGPLGYASDIKIGREQLGISNDDQEPSNFMQILANIMDYLKNTSDSIQLPPIFTMPERVAPVQNFIQQLCNRADQEDTFRIYKIDFLFYSLINAIKSNEDEGFPKESLALLQLQKDPFKYSPDLACELHEKNEKAGLCSMSHVKRWVFTILDHCCPVAGIEPKAGKHLPADLDLDKIQVYKEELKQRRGPTLGGMRDAESCNSSVVSEQTIRSNPWSMTQSTGEGSSVSQVKRIHEPLRMPKIDYSKTIRQAPDLNDDNFPKLSVGTGRGRGMTTRMSKLKIGEIKKENSD